jgi:hypothetical protein
LIDTKYKEYFPKTAPPHHRRGKTSSCRKKNCGRKSAFGLPQDLHIELMCGAGENRRSDTSVSSGVRFSQLPAWRIAPAAPLTARKCLNGRRISHRTAPRIPSRGLSASTDAMFRPVGASRGRELPSVRRNVPEVRRKTLSAPGRQPGMGLKPFN